MNNNFLDLVPQICEGLNWNKDENDFVTLEIQNRGLFNRIAQKVFKKPKISYIHLDETGSLVWQLMQSGKNIITIGEEVEKELGEKSHPLYERLAEYFRILESYGFVTFKEQ